MHAIVNLIFGTKSNLIRYQILDMNSLNSNIKNTNKDISNFESSKLVSDFTSIDSRNIQALLEFY